LQLWAIRVGRGGEPPAHAGGISKILGDESTCGTLAADPGVVSPHTARALGRATSRRHSRDIRAPITDIFRWRRGASSGGGWEIPPQLTASAARTVHCCQHRTHCDGLPPQPRAQLRTPTSAPPSTRLPCGHAATPRRRLRRCPSQRYPVAICAATLAEVHLGGCTHTVTACRHSPVRHCAHLFFAANPRTPFPLWIIQSAKKRRRPRRPPPPLCNDIPLRSAAAPAHVNPGGGGAHTPCAIAHAFTLRLI
jgi:hypothetical protein